MPILETIGLGLLLGATAAVTEELVQYFFRRRRARNAMAITCSCAEFVSHGTCAHALVMERLEGIAPKPLPKASNSTVAAVTVPTTTLAKEE